MKAPLSVVVIAKNEESNIGRCVSSVAGWADVVVVDDFSSDETAAIAEQAGARIVQHRFEGFAKQRNWALDHIRLHHPWALMLDADEALTPAAQAECVNVLAESSQDTAGFLICRKTMFLGRWLRRTDGFPVWLMRLVHRDRARFVDCGHGEVPAPPVDGLLGRIREPILHYPFANGIEHWLIRHNRYSTREAELEIAKEARWGWAELLNGSRPNRRAALRNMARRLPFRPMLRFCYHYLWKRGFLDGRAGLAFSYLMAAYEGMIVAKRWEREATVGRAQTGAARTGQEAATECGHAPRRGEWPPGELQHNKSDAVTLR